MSRPQKTKSKGQCSTPDCWQEVRCSGYCGACYSWALRVQNFMASATPGEVNHYLQRLERFGSRAERLRSMARGRARRVA